MKGRVEQQLIVEEKIQKDIESLNHYIGDYYFYLSSAKKTHKTKERYIKILIDFLKYYSKMLGKDAHSLTDEDICSVQTEHIDRYLNARSWKGTGIDKKPVSETTIALKICAINSFFVFMEKRNQIPTNPCGNKIERPKMPALKEVTYLTPDEINVVLTNIQNGIGSKKAIEQQKLMKNRDMLLFLIPIYTGLRVEALREINLEDIFLKDGYIIATDKGNKTDKHYINNDVKKILRRWLKDREEILNGTQCDALFISYQKNRISMTGIRKLVDKYTSNISKHITPHKLRATCATTLLAATNDIYLVAKVLGHSSTEPTKRYAAIDQSRIVAVPDTIGRQINSGL